MKGKNREKQLSDYQNRVKKWLEFEKSKQNKNLYNDEINTTIKFVIPLLNILGWNHINEDMEFEHAVRNEKYKGPKKADIALYVKKSLKILVEVKRIQDDLGTGKQLLEYVQKRKIDFGIYTNGKEIRLIHKKSRHSPNALFSIKVDDFIRYKKVLFSLSPKSVEKGYLNKLAESFHPPKFWQWLKKEKRNIDEDALRLGHALKKLRKIK